MVLSFSSFRPGNLPGYFALAVLSAAAAALQAQSAAEEMRLIRDRWQDVLVAASEPGDAALAKQYVEAMRGDGSWPDIDYQSRGRGDWSPLDHLRRLKTMAAAWRNGGWTEGGEGAPEPLLRGLRFWADGDFQSDNWWFRSVGTRLFICQTLLTMGDAVPHELKQALLEEVPPRPFRRPIEATGQNLQWFARIEAMRALLVGDAEAFGRAQRILQSVVRLQDDGENVNYVRGHRSGTEGIQPDFSFHQHGLHLTSLGYGWNFASDAIRNARLVEGTRFALPPEKRAILAGLLLDGTQWFQMHGRNDPTALGRGITYRRERDRRRTDELLRMARNLLVVDTGREDEIQAMIARLENPDEGPPLIGNRMFRFSDYMAHKRPGWHASARMYSERMTSNDPIINDDGYYTDLKSDASSAVLVAGLDAYQGIYPLWDWHRVPGITANRSYEFFRPGDKGRGFGKVRRLGETDFVGGLSDGTFGLAAFDFTEREGLDFRTAWFFLDRGFVRLGADIRCTSPGVISSSVAQRWAHGPVRTEGRTLEAGKTHVLNAPEWVHHADILYRFYGTPAVHTEKRHKEGLWTELNPNYEGGTGVEDRVEGDVFSLWIEHGERPEAAQYAYFVQPGIDAGEVEAALGTPEPTVIANSGALQAVYDLPSSVLQAAFYRPGEVKFGNWRLRVDEACLLQLRKQADGELKLSVADPTRKLESIEVTIHPGKAYEPFSMDIPLPRDYGEAGSTVTRAVDIP